MHALTVSIKIAAPIDETVLPSTHTVPSGGKCRAPPHDAWAPLMLIRRRVKHDKTNVYNASGYARMLGCVSGIGVEDNKRLHGRWELRSPREKKKQREN